MAACDAVESAADEDHDTFGDSDHVASDTRPVERQSRTALVQRSEQRGGKHDPEGMAASQECDRDPGETRTAVRSAVSRCCAPNSSLTAINPEKAPPPHTASTIIRGTLMPVARAANGLRPAARIS
jgi:hypothetical protein